jgi:hypothetical protein
MDKATAEGVLPADLGGKVKTADIARRVADYLDIV